MIYWQLRVNEAKMKAVCDIRADFHKFYKQTKYSTHFHFYNSLGSYNMVENEDGAAQHSTEEEEDEEAVPFSSVMEMINN